jgi:hypothetical protein
MGRRVEYSGHGKGMGVRPLEFSGQAKAPRFQAQHLSAFHSPMDQKLYSAGRYFREKSSNDRFIEKAARRGELVHFFGKSLHGGFIAIF